MKHHFSTELQPIGIDEKNGIIRGACACQAGLVARGHDLQTDRVLLNQLLMSAKAKGDKVPVHLDHKSGAAGCIGTAQNFRIDGDKLRCDLHFFRTHDKFEQTMEMLSALHETAGLSASFVGDSKDGMARCKDLLAVDVVVFPAAVANGLFSAVFDETENDFMNENEPMTHEELLEALHEAISQIDTLEQENEQLWDVVEHLQGEAEDDDEEDDEPVISETGARRGPDLAANYVTSTDFAARVEAFQLAGKSQRDSHIAALKEYARSKHQTLNL